MVKNIISNIKAFLKLDLKRELKESKKEILQLKEDLFELKNKILFHDIINYFENNPSPEYTEELEYLKKYRKVNAFPYEQVKNIDKPLTFFDEKKQLPYVIHYGKKLYFPIHWKLNHIEEVYKNYIERENLLGGGYTNKAPHKYQTESFCVNEGDIVLDIGSAEALFSLNIIEKAKHIYIFEADSMWLKPLHATFEPYKDKVTIINKLVSDKDTDKEVQLETCLKTDKKDTLFIKMDIEGFETVVLNNSKNFLNKLQNVKIVACTYHKHDDANKIKKVFDELGFCSEFSEGNILFIYGDEDLKPPYFRKGVIRATKTQVEL